MDEFFGLFLTCVLCFILGVVVHFVLISKDGYIIEQDCKVNINSTIYRVSSLEVINSGQVVLNVYELEN